MLKTHIRGLGTALPHTCITNNDFTKWCDTSDEWIKSRVGIASRFWIGDDEDTATLGAQAALEALHNANMTIDDIDAIVLSTTTPVHAFPSTAVKIQSLLGMKHGFAFDVQGACAGFVYGLSVCDAMIKAKQVKRILFIASDTMSTLIRKEERATSVIFADGAGALILEGREEDGGICALNLFSNGDFYDLLYVRKPSEGGGIHMDGREVFKHAVTKMFDALESSCQEIGIKLNDLDFVIPHQANVRIIDYMIERFHLDPKRVVKTIAHHGNTSAASIPLAMASVSLKKGDLIGVSAFGAGFAWGSAIIKM